MSASPEARLGQPPSNLSQLTPASPLTPGTSVEHARPRRHSHGGVHGARPERRASRHPVPAERAPKKEEIHVSNVALHETTHAALAYIRGYGSRVKVSIKRDGLSLGRVIVEGGMDVEDFQVMAAASSVLLEGYSPEGTGHDHYQIEEVGGPHSVESAAATAANDLRKFGPELLYRIAQILDRREEINNFGSVLEEARRGMIEDHGEAYKEPSIFSLLQPEENGMDEELQPVFEPKRTTWLETLTEDRIRIIEVIGGLVTGDETSCTRCGAQGGAHMNFCRHFGKSDENDKENKKDGILSDNKSIEEPPFTPKQLPDTSSPAQQE